MLFIVTPSVFDLYPIMDVQFVLLSLKLGKLALVIHQVSCCESIEPPVDERAMIRIAGNAITEDYALSIGAFIEQLPQKHNFVNAKNRKFEAVGTTQLDVSISDTSSPLERKWSCSFAVVKQLAAPLVLGSQFLRTTETLTRLSHLLVKKTMSTFHDRLQGSKKVWRLMHMNLPTQELACSLGEKTVCAALDSGSDIDVISLDYARSRRWRVKPLPKRECYVLLANEELVKLTGYVETTFEYAGENPMQKRFHVLDGLVCDVVLGDATLEALDVFNTAVRYITECSTSQDLRDFRMIQWIEQIDKIGLDAEGILTDFDSLTTSSGWTNITAALRRLRQMLEDVEVRSANWRRSAEEVLLDLTGDEHSHRKEEFDKRKKKNEEIRDKILSHILRIQQSGPGSVARSAQTTSEVGQST